METPKGKMNRISLSTRASTSTPKQDNAFHTIENDYSPLFMANTQESIESVDVVWDWNSPQSKPKSKSMKHPKRLYQPKSPVHTLQIHNKHMPSFDKLKEQLEGLRNQIKLSKEVKHVEDSRNNSPLRSHRNGASPRNLMTKAFSSESLGASFIEEGDFESGIQLNKSANNTFPLDDSLDMVLEEFKNEDFELLSQALPAESKKIKPTKSSVESLNKAKNSDEKKPKLQKSSTEENPSVSMPIVQCSPEEIEKKRKVALAKLEERRIQDIIEKKRQEALKRLQNTRLKKSQGYIKRYNSS